MDDRTRTALRCGCLALMGGLWLAACAKAPAVKPGPAAPAPPPPPAGFVMKPYQRSMCEAMRASYERAGEIILGVFEGIRRAESGTAYYFKDVSRFNKETLSWEPPLDLMMEVRRARFEPEIIRRDEFKRLVDLDKVGICWDVKGASHNVFLVEGRKNLVFLEPGYDDAAGRSYRNLLDAYPETRECRAADVFLMMLQDLATPSSASR